MGSAKCARTIHARIVLGREPRCKGLKPAFQVAYCTSGCKGPGRPRFPAFGATLRRRSSPVLNGLEGRFRSGLRFSLICIRNRGSRRYLMGNLGPRRLARPKKAGQNSVLAADRNVPTRAWGILECPNSPPRHPAAPDLGCRSRSKGLDDRGVLVYATGRKAPQRRRDAPKAGDRGVQAPLTAVYSPN